MNENSRTHGCRRMLVVAASAAVMVASVTPSATAVTPDVANASATPLTSAATTGPTTTYERRQGRRLVPFKPYKGTFPIGSWRSRAGTHKVKVVVMYTQSLIPLQEVVAQTREAAGIWAREVPGLNFRFGHPSARKTSRAVVCSPGRAWKAALGKTKLGKKRHLLVVSPECGSDLSGWGLGTMGKGSGKAFSAGNHGDIFAHELGHNLGLPHENGLRCFDSAGRPVPLSKRCQESEYEDDGTLMGAGTSVRSPRLGPTGQGLLTRNAIRIKNGATTIVTLSNAGGPGRRLAVIKGTLGSLLFDMSPGRSWNPESDPGGLQARLVTVRGAGLLRLPDQQGNLSNAADSVLQTGESWVIPGTRMRVTVLAFQMGAYVTVRFSPA